MKNRVKKITLELNCSECGKPFVAEATVKGGFYACDCDMPCGCDNGAYQYIGCTCPHCQKENKPFILKKL